MELQQAYEKIKELEETLKVYRTIIEQLPRASDYKHYMVECLECSKPTLNSSAVECACGTCVCWSCIKAKRFPKDWKETSGKSFECLKCNWEVE